VLKQSGMRLSSIQVLHVNTDYVRGVRDISWPHFFHREEVKAEVLKRIGAIAGQLRQQRTCLSRPRAPKVEPEAHCHAPYPCEHWEACTASKPADWIYHMPNFSAERRAELGRLKVESISKIPQDIRLSAKQRIIRDVTRTGKPYVSGSFHSGSPPLAHPLSTSISRPSFRLSRCTRGPVPTRHCRFSGPCIESTRMDRAPITSFLPTELWIRAVASPRR
jgi:hypothetical protein